MLKIRKAYKVQLKTNSNIEHKLVRYCGSTRFLWNKCLAMNLERLEKKQGILWYKENADVNAVMNILTVGQTGMMACQANRVSGRHQEPVGTREEVLLVAL